MQRLASVVSKATQLATKTRIQSHLGFTPSIATIFRTQEDPKKEDTGHGRKVPSGFEKLLKKSKRGQSSKEDDHESKKTAAEEEKDAEKDEDDDRKGSEKKEDSQEQKSEDKDRQKELKDMFFQPNNGGPKWESWLMLALVGAAGLYYGYSLKTQSREISYVEFI